VDLSVAVNQLFSSIDPSLPENQYFPQFAKERVLWITTEKKAGKLSIILLKNTDNTNLYFEDLMASGIVEGKPMIVIAGPRFLDFLTEGGRTSPPFPQRQRKRLRPWSDSRNGSFGEGEHRQSCNFSRASC